ncbi:MAG: hypothetical protein KJ915_05800 [Candidatus Omnitrophica bacterium]|nr:hypothetical protein [Candidatus Omnitrophota bacterium]
MYINDNNFGVQINANSIGEAWVSMVEAIINEGSASYDEERKRTALQNLRLKVNQQNSSDPIFEQFANKENLNHMKNLMFNKAEMFDFDVVPSFSKGAKSYYQRITEGKMFDFVIKRLSYIPESKKAVMVFPTYEDYKQVLENQKDDYLPCLVAFQTRLLKMSDDYYIQNNIFFMRSWDAFQKAPGNLLTMVMLSEKISRGLSLALGKEVKLGSLDGLITDAHIYEETIEDAKNLLKTTHTN